ncbi:MAG: hypothetical protein HUJ31_19970, partial [Pseudomonadales bacterium]|nr:hypothetical protein [Pseudomonadales bacterium]
MVAQLREIQAEARQRPTFLTRGNIIAAGILIGSTLWLAWWFWASSH